MERTILEIFFSFTCSIGFGIVFKIKPKELPYAGLAGVIVRIALILAQLVTGNRLVYTFIGALVGTFYAEFLGTAKKTSIAKFMYPAMVPMIPGDLLYNVIVGIVTLDGTATLENGVSLMSSLVGIALGCIVAPMLLHSRAYVRSAVGRA
jgi:uncharacterized membrane protein YjjB (DUF3815 family)